MTARSIDLSRSIRGVIYSSSRLIPTGCSELGRRPQGDVEGDVDPGRHRHPTRVVADARRKPHDAEVVADYAPLTVVRPVACWSELRRGRAQEGALFAARACRIVPTARRERPPP